MSSAFIADGRTWPLAFELYLPTSWTDDPARCAAAGIPPTVRFREKWRIALAQVRTVLQAGFTITGVVVDADYGANAAFRAGLERLGLAYGVAIRGEAVFTVPGVGGPLSAITLADSAPDDAWGDGDLGHGHRGPPHGPVLRARPLLGTVENADHEHDSVSNVYTTTYGNGARTSSLVPSRFPGRPRFGNVSNAAGASYTRRSSSEARSGACSRR